MTWQTWQGTPDVETFKVGGLTFKTQDYGHDVAGNYRTLTDPEGVLMPGRSTRTTG